MALQTGKNKTSARTGLYDGALFTDDWSLSGQGASTAVQRGSFALVAGVATVNLPRFLVSSTAGNVVFQVTSRTTNHMFVDEIVSSNAFGSLKISTVSAFRVSGSGSDTGFWTAYGYTK